MDMVFIASVVLLILIPGVLYWVLKPFWTGASYVVTADSLPQQTLAVELEQRRDTLYSAIKDLELDFETDKIPAADYQQVRANFVQQAANVLKQIDRLSQDRDGKIDTWPTQFQPNGPSNNKALLETTRAGIKGEATADHHSACPNCHHSTHPDDAFCSRCGIPLTNHCPTCQEVTRPGDAFCTRCGTRLVLYPRYVHASAWREEKIV